MWIVQKQIGYTSREVLYLMLEQQLYLWTPAQPCNEDKVAKFAMGSITRAANGKKMRNFLQL